jgi:hypothetical protein
MVSSKSCHPLIKFNCRGTLTTEYGQLTSRQKTVHINRRFLVLSLSLVLTVNGQPSYPIKVVTRIFTGSTYQQVLFFVNQIVPPVFAVLKVWRQLDGVCGAGFFTETAENTAGEIDAKKFRVPTAPFILGSLQSNAVHRAGYRAEITGHAPLLPIGIPGENDPAPKSWRQIYSFFRILNGLSPAKRMQQYGPHGSQNTEHGFLLTSQPTASTIPPVTIRFSNDKGSSTFQA